MIGRSVVVGVDDSREARDAAVLGRRLADAAGAPLHLVSAVSDPLADATASRLRLDVDALHDALIAGTRDGIEKHLSDDFETGSLDEILAVRIGRPERVLEIFAEEVDAGLFVLGGRRHRGAASWLRRGTAHHLLRAGRRPVLVTGPNGPRVDRVLAAVDLSPAAEPTLDAARELADLLDVGLGALHVVALPRLPPGWELGVDRERLLESLEERARRELWPLLPDEASRTIVRGDLVPAIRRVAEEEPPALLVLGARGRGRIDRLLLGSTTEAFLTDVPVSLMIVPRSRRDDR